MVLFLAVVLQQHYAQVILSQSLNNRHDKQSEGVATRRDHWKHSHQHHAATMISQLNLHSLAFAAYPIIDPLPIVIFQINIFCNEIVVVNDILNQIKASVGSCSH
mmetsp:Transcript_18123/g.22837  ORF Transcript_18123/g.22837 Transcript_18123/m.22837 type:complete len:105 (-) Transcript_18123:152-466(-)